VNVRVDNPKRVELLIKGDVVLLPTYGESRVMKEPSLLPASNRTVVVIIVSCNDGIKRLLCARNMCLQYLRFDG
jgi:hypothetical protein